MSCRIVAKRGAVSDASFKLEAPVVRVGSDGVCELVVLKQELPPIIFILRKTSEQNVWNLFCRCSNLVTLNGTLLDEHSCVDWRVGETLFVGKIVEFELVRESSRGVFDNSKVQQSQTSGSVRKSVPSPSSTTSSENRRAKVGVSSKESTPKSGGFDAKQAIQLGVIVACGLVLLAFFLFSPSKVVPSQSQRTVISNEKAIGFCGSDETMKTLCINGVLNERNHPELARQNFRKLEVYARKMYEKEGNDLCKERSITISNETGQTTQVVTYRDFFEYLSAKLENL